MRIRNAMTVFGLVVTLAATSYSATAAGAQLSSASSAKPLQTFDDAYGVTPDAGFSLPAIPIQRVKPEDRKSTRLNSSHRP